MFYENETERTRMAKMTQSSPIDQNYVAIQRETVPRRSLASMVDVLREQRHSEVAQDTILGTATEPRKDSLINFIS